MRSENIQFLLKWAEVIHTGDRFKPDINITEKLIDAANLAEALEKAKKLIQDRQTKVAKWNKPGGALVVISNPALIARKKITLEITTDISKTPLPSPD